MALAHHSFSFMITGETMSISKEREYFSCQDSKFQSICFLVTGKETAPPEACHEHRFDNGDGNTSAV